MIELVELLTYANNLLFGGLALVCFLRWKRRREEAAGWLALTFGVLTALALQGALLPENDPSSVIRWAEKLGIAALVLFPYFLYRFMASFEEPSSRVRLSVSALTATVFVWSLLLPRMPDESAARPASFQAFILALLVQWTALSLIVAARLWRAGRGHSTVGRRRMRLLSVASVGLNVALVLAGAAPPDHSTALDAVVQLFALASACSFFVGFSPPDILRAAWRRGEEEALRRVIGELMSATEAEEITTRLLPHVANLVAGEEAALVDERETVIGSYGRTPGLEAAHADGAGAADGNGVADARPIRLRLSKSSLLVWATPYTPFFERDEFTLLRSVGSLTELALERVASAEKEARLAAIVESSNDAIIGHDLGGTIVSWNAGASRLYGYSAAEALGKPYSSLVPADDLEGGTKMLQKIKRGDRIEHYETARLHKDGRRIHVSLTASPVWDRNGDLSGASIIARDITERRAHEEAQRAAEERYRSIFENALAGIFEASPEGAIVTANPALATMLRYESPQEVTAGMNDIGSLVQQPAKRQELMQLVHDEGVVKGFEVKGSRGDGETLWLSLDVRPRATAMETSRDSKAWPWT
ncbi:MAG: PAS domain-containing protein [Actinomycetota bacterium]